MRDWMRIFDLKGVADLIAEKIVEDDPDWFLTQYDDVPDLLQYVEENLEDVRKFMKEHYSEMIEKELKQAIMDNNLSVVKGVNYNAE